MLDADTDTDTDPRGGWVRRRRPHTVGILVVLLAVAGHDATDVAAVEAKGPEIEPVVAEGFIGRELGVGSRTKTK